MRRAFLLAERGRGETSPNPLVGCVLERDGAIVGEGCHEKSGGPHAEAAALDAAGPRARGAVGYVTLEPCNHFGRTPPCASRLIAAGLSRVVVGIRDPNPHVCGGGIEALRGAGIEVELADNPAPFEEQNEAWLKWVTTGLPWLRLKTAVTLDGRPGLEHGSRSTLTGEEAGTLTMRLRAASDAVMVGAETQRIDDPLLTVRTSVAGQGVPGPLRVVLARESLPNPRGRIFREPGRTMLLASDRASAAALRGFAESGVELATYPAGEGFSGALAALGKLGVLSILLETGPTLFEAAWSSGEIDELILFHAGGIGGNGAPPLVAGQVAAGRARLPRKMRAVEAGLAGGDAVSVWRPWRN